MIYVVDPLTNHIEVEAAFIVVNFGCLEFYDVWATHPSRIFAAGAWAEVVEKKAEQKEVPF